MLKRLILMALLSLSGMAAEPTLEFIRLSEGVDGGYAPRPVQCQLLIVGRNDGPYDVYYKRRIDGGNSILYQCWRTTTTTTSLDGLEKELEQMGFFGLPQIAPDEQDDIYRQKIGLEIRTSRHRWRHSPPVGCIRTRSPVQTNETQRQLFLKSVQRVRQMAQGGQECSVAEMDQAQQTVYNSKD